MKKTIDATNKRLGNLAQEVAKVLMGKDSVDFAKNTIADVQVLVINADKLDITDKKKDEKYYLTYSGYPGGQKKEFLGHLMERKGVEEVIVRAVSRMLPKNKLRDRMLLNIEITKINIMATKSTSKYYEAVGRRKTSSARVRITPAAKNTLVVNEKPHTEYFKTKELQNTSIESLVKIAPDKTFEITVKVIGGGVNGQAEAIRLGLARALEVFDEELHTALKKEGFLTRDGRAKERRKFGLKKARKSKQWSKR